MKMRTQVIRITGPAHKVFLEISLLAILHPNKTIGELAKEKNNGNKGKLL